MPKDREIEPQRHFVAGGAGFIGSHLVERLLAAVKRVTVYDNLASGRLTWIERHLSNPAFRFERADLLNADRLTEEMASHDLVWHLGANTDIPSGCEDVNLDLRNCVLATHNTLEAMRKNGIREIIFSSTSAVYGEAPESPTPETAGPLRPISLSPVRPSGLDVPLRQRHRGADGPRCHLRLHPEAAARPPPPGGVGRRPAAQALLPGGGLHRCAGVRPPPP